MRPLCRFRRSPCDTSGQSDSADNKAHSLVSAGAGAGAGQGQDRAGRGTCGTLLVYAMLFKIHTGIFFHFITFSLIEKINTS